MAEWPSTNSSRLHYTPSLQPSEGHSYGFSISCDIPAYHRTWFGGVHVPSSPERSAAGDYSDRSHAYVCCVLSHVDGDLYGSTAPSRRAISVAKVRNMIMVGYRTDSIHYTGCKIPMCPRVIDLIVGLVLHNSASSRALSSSFWCGSWRVESFTSIMVSFSCLNLCIPRYKF